jgi:hypothetical protein
MKKIPVIIVTFLLSLSYCFSQDIITKKSGEEIQAKILEVNPTNVKYKRFDYLDGPIFTLLKSDIAMILYQNGVKELFNDNEQKSPVSIVSPAPSVARGDLYLQGQKDARRYYKKYKGAGTGTLITSLLSPLVGLIPAIACSSTTPKESNLNYPNAELFKQADYKEGYIQQAKK